LDWRRQTSELRTDISMTTYHFWTNNWRLPPQGKKGYLALVQRTLEDGYIFPTTEDTIFINGVEREAIKVESSLLCYHMDLDEFPQQILVWVKR
jgi:hypothetical protein